MTLETPLLPAITATCSTQIVLVVEMRVLIMASADNGEDMLKPFGMDPDVKISKRSDIRIRLNLYGYFYPHSFQYEYLNRCI
jgi:hypothetical protein